MKEKVKSNNRMKTKNIFYANTLALRKNFIRPNSQQRTKLTELIKTDKDTRARFETLKRATDKAPGEKPNPIQGCDAGGWAAGCRITHPGNP